MQTVVFIFFFVYESVNQLNKINIKKQGNIENGAQGCLRVRLFWTKRQKKKLNWVVQEFIKKLNKKKQNKKQKLFFLFNKIFAEKKSQVIKADLRRIISISSNGCHRWLNIIASIFWFCLLNFSQSFFIMPSRILWTSSNHQRIISFNILTNMWVWLSVFSLEAMFTHPFVNRLGTISLKINLRAHFAIFEKKYWKNFYNVNCSRIFRCWAIRNLQFLVDFSFQNNIRKFMFGLKKRFYKAFNIATSSLVNPPDRMGFNCRLMTTSSVRCWLVLKNRKIMLMMLK